MQPVTLHHIKDLLKDYFKEKIKEMFLKILFWSDDNSSKAKAENMKKNNGMVILETSKLSHSWFYI